MPISYVGAGALSTGTTTTLTPAVPAHTSGDLLLIFIKTWVANNPPTSPGWSLLGWVEAYGGGPDFGTLAVLGKFGSGAESDPTVTIGDGSNGWVAAVGAWSGVHADIFDRGLDAFGAAAAATFTPVAQPTSTPGAVQISFVSAQGNRQLALNTAQGFTARMSGASYSTATGSGNAIGVADQTIASPGLQTQPTWAQTGGPSAYLAGTLSLRPADANPTAPVFIGGSGTQVSVVAGTSTATLGVDVQADDVIVSALFSAQNAATFTPPAGFVQLFRRDSSVNATWEAFYKVADGTETTVAVGAPQTTLLHYCEVYRYADPTNPVPAAAVTTTATSNVATFTPDPVTATAATDAALSYAVKRSGATDNGLQLDTAEGFGQTAGFHHWRQSGNSLAVGSASKPAAAAVAVTQPTYETTGGSTGTWYGAAALLALEPQPEPPAPSGNRMGDGAIRRRGGNPR